VTTKTNELIEQVLLANQPNSANKIAHMLKVALSALTAISFGVHGERIIARNALAEIERIAAGRET